MLLTNRSCPGTSTKPKRTPCSSRKANPKSMVMPRRFSSSSRSGCVPVSASTSADLPWSICPAVPTMTLFVAAGFIAVAMVIFRRKFPSALRCYWRGDSGVKRGCYLAATWRRQFRRRSTAPRRAARRRRESAGRRRRNRRPREWPPGATPCVIDRRRKVGARNRADARRE